MAKIADGVIIGSAIVDIVAKEKTNAPQALEKYTQEICTALRTKVEQ